MTTLNSLKKVISKAKAVQEAAAAATAELTNQITQKEPTTFVFSSDGVNFNQLSTEIKKLASPSTQLVKEGGVIRVISTNPTAVTKVLRYLGIASEVDGTVNLDKEDKEQPVWVINPNQLRFGKV